MKRNILIMNQAQCLTSCIVHLADSANFEGVTSNIRCSGLTVSCFESPNDTIHVTVISLQLPPLIPLIDCLLHVFFEKGAKSFHFAEKGRFWGFFWGFWRVFGGDILK
ncbi:MAG: hypothetical protein WC142_09860 [Bacteroidales bacterium]